MVDIDPNIIIQDTREQTPWDFTFYGYTHYRHSLKTGDYTLAKYKKVLCIERKKTTGELALNLGRKSKQFYEELERMKEFPYKYLILEFSEDTLKLFPKASGIPYRMHKFMRINANYMISSLDKIRSDYDIEIIFAGDAENAINEVLKIFDKVKNEDGNKQPIF